MTKTRKNKSRKQQLLKFKNSRKMSENKNLTMPSIRNVPIWDGNAKFEVYAFEWEAIQNGLVNIQLAQQAAQSVMSRNILNGVVRMDFEKLNPQTLQYEPMDDEEKKEYADQFNETIESFKKANEVVNKPTESIAVPSETTEDNGSGAKIISL